MDSLRRLAGLSAFCVLLSACGGGGGSSSTSTGDANPPAPAPASPAPAPPPPPAPSPSEHTDTYRWGSVAMGGGGFVTAVIPSKTQRNLFYARTDVGGAYRWDNAPAAP